MPDAKPTVYFDGSCPLCRREIDFYRKQRGSNAITWIDVSLAEPTALGKDLTRDAAMARFHVRRADGALVSGAAGFATLWRHVPRFARLGKAAALPGIRTVLEIGYRVFLRVRPALQRLMC